MDCENLKATRQSYGEKLAELGEKNKDIIVLDADLSAATKTSIFAKRFPERFFDMGIAEQDMISTAAGLATFGKTVFASSFAMFACGRSYDQIRNSVAHPKLNVKICASHAGITVGEDGATHQMLEDLGMMRGLPNMTVMCTSDDRETKWAVEEISKMDGPVYLRLCRLNTPQIYGEEQDFKIGKGVQIGNGTDATVFATGVVVPEAIKAKEELTLLDLHKGSNIASGNDMQKVKWISGLKKALSAEMNFPNREYSLTQKISEYARKKAFDGIMYHSTFHVDNLEKTDRGSINYAIFNYEKCEPISSKLYFVKNVDIQLEAFKEYKSK